MFVYHFYNNNNLKLNLDIFYFCSVYKLYYIIPGHLDDFGRIENNLLGSKYF